MKKAKPITCNGESKTRKEWAIFLGVEKYHIEYRLCKGWPMEDIVAEIQDPNFQRPNMKIHRLIEVYKRIEASRRERLGNELEVVMDDLDNEGKYLLCSKEPLVLQVA